MSDTSQCRIFRANRRNNFTILSNEIFIDTKGKSLKAIGLLCYLLHLPENWMITKSNLQNVFNEGRHAIDTAIKELINAGYMRIKERPREGGKFKGYDYFVFDDPLTDVDYPHAVYPLTDKPTTDKPHADNPQLLNNNLQKTNQKSTKEKKEIKKDATVKNGGLVAVDLSLSKLPDNPINDPNQAHLTGAENLGNKTAKTKNYLYTQVIDIYDKWYKDLNSGIPPKIDGAGGNAAKSIIQYLKAAFKTKFVRDNPHIAITDEILEEGVLKSWSWIFSNWNRLDTFHQQKTRLIDINSNFTNIITQIKNGIPRKQTNNHTTGSEVKDSFSRIDNHFANGK